MEPINVKEFAIEAIIEKLSPAVWALGYALTYVRLDEAKIAPRAEKPDLTQHVNARKRPHRPVKPGRPATGKSGRHYEKCSTPGCDQNATMGLICRACWQKRKDEGLKALAAINARSSANKVQATVPA
jgi:hypothetical protein